MYIEFINAAKLQQDHPCVIHVIRRFYLHHPASKDAPLRLESPDEVEPSAGQALAILKHLNFKVKIFKNCNNSILNNNIPIISSVFE